MRNHKKDLSWEVIIHILGVASMALFYRNNEVMMLISGALLLLGWQVWDKKPYDNWMMLSMFVFSAIGENIYTYFGLQTYANPNFLVIPLWVPLVYTYGLTNLIKMSHTIWELKGKKIEPQKLNTGKELFFSITIFALLVFLLSLLWTNGILLTFLIILLSIIAFKVWKTEGGLLYTIYIVGFLLTFTADIFAVPAGTWWYGNPTILYLPIWLPFAYALGNLLGFRFGKAITQVFQ